MHMGSLGIMMDRPRSVGQFLDKELSWEGAQVVKSATKGGTYYGAFKNRQDELFAVVVVFSYGQGEFIYKAMDEGMGPYQTECPVAILNLLTATTDPNAIEWRRKCRETAARRTSTLNIQNGTVVKFDTPLSFGPYGVHDTFTVRSVGKKVRFEFYDRGGMCRITKWQTRPFTILTSIDY
jgi:hypothetical protein